jgi:hypothetical protein
MSKRNGLLERPWRIDLAIPSLAHTQNFLDTALKSLFKIGIVPHTVAFTPSPIYLYLSH